MIRSVALRTWTPGLLPHPPKESPLERIVSKYSSLFISSYHVMIDTLFDVVFDINLNKICYS